MAATTDQVLVTSGRRTGKQTAFERELLEMAAKAAVIFMRKEEWPFSDPFDPSCLETSYDPETKAISGTRVWYGQNGDIGGTEKYKWSPLTDDGDCARMEAAVGIDLTWHRIGVAATHYWSDSVFREPYEDHRGDRQAARRLASLRVAAAVGRAMP